jgi:nucleoside-diphosphate-sugar epimerase
VIPTIITQLLAGVTEIKLGSLDPTRDFNYVKDTVNGFVEIAKSDQTIGEEINIATGVEISVGEMAQELISQINPQSKIVTDSDRLRPRKSEVNRLLGCNKKISTLTDWKPQYNLARGLSESIEWFKNPKNLAKYKANIYNI